MAIDTRVTCTLDPSAASKPDRADHRNTFAFAAADGGNVTLAIDSAVITRLTQLDSAYATLRAVYAGRLVP